MPFNIGPLELIIILAIALLVIGPRRLPEMGSALGKTIREFRNASSDVADATSTRSGSASAMPANTLRDESEPNTTRQRTAAGPAGERPSDDT